MDEAPLILHVEDDDGEAHIVVRMLAQAPFRSRISRALDGREALRMLAAIREGERELPDLILLDLKLPFYSGVEVLAEIREHAVTAPIPVVILTSSESLEDMKRCADAGCDDYVNKPFDLGDFKHVLYDVCTRHLAAFSAAHKVESYGLIA